MRPRFSIRGRLILAAAVLLVAALTIGGYGLNLIFQRHIERRFAAELQNRLLEVAGGFSLDASGQPVLGSLPLDPRYNQPYGGAYWYVRNGQAFLLRSRSLWDADLVLPGSAEHPPGNVFLAAGPDQSSLMIAEREISFGTGAAENRFRLGVALDRAELQTLSSAFAADTALGLFVLGLVLFGAAWFQMGYGLRPLKVLREQLAALHDGKADTLKGPFPDEVAGLALDLNALFAQQKMNLQKAQERAGTLAHALKTPLTILNSEAHKLDQQGLVTPAEAIREQTNLLRKQVDRELARARVTHSASNAGTVCNATDIARRIVGLMQRMPRGDALIWSISGPDACFVAMDADDFAEILGNLLDNARKWARSKVELTLTHDTAHLDVSVSDDGPGIPPNYRDKALQRGETRAAHTDDSGLGLAIVADILAAYGSAPMIAESSTGGARLSFTIAAR